MPEPVVLINVFEVPAADAQQFVAAWEKTRDYLQRYPAHLETALHQALGSDADFQFVNVAHWHSAEEFTEAVSSPASGKPAPTCAGASTLLSIAWPAPR